jgi:uncharacterized protein YukE
MTMDGKFSVQPDSFTPAANQLRGVAEQIVSAWEPVREQSAAVRFGRGDDVLSPLVQVSLEAAMSLVDETMNTCSQALADYADGLEDMGKTYQDTDDLITYGLAQQAEL